MQKINTKYRSSEFEIMDDFNLKGEALKTTLRDLERVNNLLGGNRVTLKGIEKLIDGQKKTLSIADIGCGNGATLRRIALWGRRNNLVLKLLGIDANPHTIEIAEELSKEFPEISFKAQNIFSESFKENGFDIVSCSLTLHHFKDEEIKFFLETIKKQTKKGIVINDLHRSKSAYYLFRLFCVFFVSNPIAKKDGLVSILRGFKRAEIEELSKQLNLKNPLVKWCWAFRYQWIISNTASPKDQS